MSKWQLVLADLGADVVKIVTAWAITVLSVTGVSFNALAQQKSLIALTIALGTYAGAWAANFRKTGDPTPPAAVALAASPINPDLVAADVMRRLGVWLEQTAPQAEAAPTLETFHQGEAGPAPLVEQLPPDVPAPPLMPAPA